MNEYTYIIFDHKGKRLGKIEFGKRISVPSASEIEEAIKDGFPNGATYKLIVPINVCIANRKKMNDILFNKIKKANSKYAEYLSACDKVAKAAQKHINWNDSVGCAYMPGDGLCIEIEAHVCPATRFFELPEIIGNDIIDEYTYRTNCI